MALPDLDSSVGHSFGLEFDGVVIKQIAEVSGLKIDQDVVELKQDTDSGKFIRKGGAIIVFDYEGTTIKRYKLTNAWPKTLEIGSLKAGDTSVLAEKLTLTYEGCEASDM